MARVAVIPVLLLLALLTGCGGSNDDPAPESEAEPRPSSVYIERGFIPATMTTANGSLACGEGVLASELVQDGTVSVDGTLVTATWDETTVTVMFDGPGFAQSIVVNDKYGAVLVENAQSTGFVMDFGTDWKPAAPAKKFVLCGGGM
jgi:hypothetical protein